MDFRERVVFYAKRAVYVEVVCVCMHTREGERQRDTMFELRVQLIFMTHQMRLSCSLGT